MADEYRAVRKSKASLDSPVTFNHPIPHDLQADAPEGTFYPPKRVDTYLVPSAVTEAEWRSYPAALKQYIKDTGLYDVKSDADVREARAEASGEAKADEPPASQDKTAGAAAAAKARGANGTKSGQE